MKTTTSLCPPPHPTWSLTVDSARLPTQSLTQRMAPQMQFCGCRLFAISILAAWSTATEFSEASVYYRAGAGIGVIANQTAAKDAAATFWNNQTINWTQIGGNDPDDGVTESLDFVGNTNYPGLYAAYNNSYVFFSMRVDADTFAETATPGSHFVLIDVAGDGVSGINYGFAWDSQSTDIQKHGLEMVVRSSKNGPTWGEAQTDDKDGQPSNKTAVDINGLISVGVYDSTDGYIRTRDGIDTGTGNFGSTTFIDFAVEWNYLQSNTGLAKGQTWNIALASILNKTDHNAFSTDVSGGDPTSQITTGWSASWSAVPEPGSALAGPVIGRRPAATQARLNFKGDVQFAARRFHVEHDGVQLLPDGLFQPAAQDIEFRSGNARASK